MSTQGDEAPQFYWESSEVQVGPQEPGELVGPLSRAEGREGHPSTDVLKSGPGSEAVDPSEPLLALSFWSQHLS